MPKRNKKKDEPKSNSFLELNADRIVLGLVALCLVAFAIHHIVAYDFWWQLKTGELIRADGFPSTDPFSYAFPDRPWVEVRWLYCVAISLIYDWFGPNALILAKVPLLLLGGFCLWSLGRGQHRWVVGLGLLSALLLMHQRLTLRPELVTFVLLAAFLLALRRYETERKLFWLVPLPLLQILWVNSHSIYVLGPVVMILFTAAQFASAYVPSLRSFCSAPLPPADLKRLAVFTVAVFLACLVNPYGVKGAVFALQLFTETMGDKLSGMITELRSPFAAAGLSLLFVSYAVVLLISAGGFWLRRRELPLPWFALWAAFLYLSVTTERNLAIFGIVACAAIIVCYGAIDARRGLVWTARVACAGVMLVTIPLVVSNYYYRPLDPDRRFGLGIAERRFPIKAMEFVDAQQLPQPTMTNLGESAYAIFKYGSHSVYADGRLEVYGPANTTAAVKTFSSGEGLIDVAKRNNVFTLVAHIENDISLVRLLLSDVAWTPVYFDDSHMIFVRNADETASITERLKIDWKSPPSFAVETPAQFRSDGPLSHLFPSVGDSSPSRALGQLFLTVGETQRAQQQLEEAVRQWPDDPRACFLLGVLDRAQGRESEAARLFGRVPKDQMEQPADQVLAATTYERFGNMSAATDAWIKVVSLGMRTQPIYQHLAAAAGAAERWDAAYTAMDALNRMSPDDVNTLNGLATVADNLNKWREALTALERSLKIKPDQAMVATQMGAVKMKMGDVTGARLAFEQALTIDPSFEPARQNLERLSREQPRR